MNGVDRRNNLVGYEVENSIPCCTHCNRIKLNYSEEEFLNKIKKIYENKNLKNLEDISYNYEI